MRHILEEVDKKMFHLLDNGKVAIVGAFPDGDEQLQTAETIFNQGQTEAIVLVDKDRLRNEALILIASWMENQRLESFEFKGLEIRRKV